MINLQFAASLIKNSRNPTIPAQTKVLNKNGQLHNNSDYNILSVEGNTDIKNAHRINQRLANLTNDYDDQEIQDYLSKEINKGSSSNANSQQQQQLIGNQSKPPMSSQYQSSQLRGSNLSRQNPQRGRQTQMTVFPMYGLWDGKSTFKSTNQVNNSYVANERASLSTSNSEELNVDRSNFRKVYFEKTYMEELLKMKNMMGKVKK
ncbi:UNKNOWN [Stylonychia lemnae]|uniref:Uncharacterized protein n=1 Tax=Stylonychia lemnae TaxID=5949 RepID=A0A078AI82_STYLE|nr:UNKNOWN [Stylonychia lemnae]|eukprot:CDW81641.1 UNKNOWN [Stylonychia lemnae]